MYCDDLTLESLFMVHITVLTIQIKHFLLILGIMRTHGSLESFSWRDWGLSWSLTGMSCFACYFHLLWCQLLCLNCCIELRLETTHFGIKFRSIISHHKSRSVGISACHSFGHAWDWPITIYQATVFAVPQLRWYLRLLPACCALRNSGDRWGHTTQMLMLVLSSGVNR